MQVKNNRPDFRSSCSISCALDLLGDKWTLLIIRDALFLGSKSFGDFSSSPEKIATNILTNRLEKLVSYGILTKTRNAKNKLKNDYILTDRGKQLEPVLLALGKWAYSNISGTNDVQEQINKFSKQ
jgi:DNA-binding HxlR family transcriptional regulator